MKTFSQPEPKKTHFRRDHLSKLNMASRTYKDKIIKKNTKKQKRNCFYTYCVYACVKAQLQTKEKTYVFTTKPSFLFLSKLQEESFSKIADSHKKLRKPKINLKASHTKGNLYSSHNNSWKPIFYHRS